MTEAYIDGAFIGHMLTLTLVALTLQYKQKDRFFVYFALFLLTFALSFDSNRILGHYNFIAGSFAAFFFFIAIDYMVGFSESKGIPFTKSWGLYIILYICLQIFFSNTTYPYKYIAQKYFLLSLWIPGVLFFYEIFKHNRSLPYYLLASGCAAILSGITVNYHILELKTIGFPLYLGALGGITLTFTARITWHEMVMKLPTMPPERRKEAKPEKTFTEKLEGVVAANYTNDNFDVAALTTAMGVSHTTLNRKVKESLNKTPSNYLREYRLAKAKELLLANRLLSISDIAYQVGFRTPNYFTQAFTKKFGESPTVFREKNGF